MADRHPDDALLIDLALCDIDERQRDALTGHLALCEPCRARYTAVADSVDHVLAAAPRVAPPPGFSVAVLAAMGIGGPGLSGPHRPTHHERGPGPRLLEDPEPPTGPPVPGQRRGSVAPVPQPAEPTGGPPTPGGRGRRRASGGQRIWPAAVAAVLALLVGAAGTAFVLDRSQAPSVEVAAVGPALTTGEGVRVGTVLNGSYDGQPVLVVTLTNGPVGVRYDCQLVLADGTRQSAGSWVLSHSPGATWVIPRPESHVARVDLVTGTGVTWASATL